MTAISASAPIWGLPYDSCPIDSSAQVVTYSASSSAGAEPLCIPNLKSSYILLHDIGSTSTGREYLSKQLNLCDSLTSSQDVAQLLSYLQTPLFNLAEGSYPFPSSYITFALTGTSAELPPWAMKEMCSTLGRNYSITFEGVVEENDFQLLVQGNSRSIEITVNWDQTTNNGYSIEDIEETEITELLQEVVKSIQIWYNVTQTLPSCIDWKSSAPNEKVTTPQYSLSRYSRSKRELSTIPSLTPSSDHTCTLSSAEFTAGMGWNTLVCNEGINLVNWWAQGMGNDLYWPPNQPRGSSLESMIPTSLIYCQYYESIGLYGLPKKADIWARWLDTAYGGLRIQYASNIVFTNGNLDPWSPAGVRPQQTPGEKIPLKTLSNDGSVLSLSIDMGGHHLDLFWSDENDPQSVKDVRSIEREHIRKWIREAAQNRM
jgi:hypothetical protein